MICIRGVLSEKGFQVFKPRQQPVGAAFFQSLDVGSGSPSRGNDADGYGTACVHVRRGVSNVNRFPCGSSQAFQSRLMRSVFTPPSGEPVSSTGKKPSR